MAREANAGGRKAAGNWDTMTDLCAVVPGKLAGQGCCPTRKGADAGQVSLCRITEDDTGTQAQVVQQRDPRTWDAELRVYLNYGP